MFESPKHRQNKGIIDWGSLMMGYFVVIKMDFEKKMNVN